MGTEIESPPSADCVPQTNSKQVHICIIIKDFLEK